ncbi:Arachidonate--CoA ligase [Aphelenchoides fujianensis]|nr:Arachidonate--CoA ligase [Aphelenchoides fujianensis]
MAGGVDAFYQRSRLHLISTLAQDMRKFVCEMRSKADGHVFKSRERENFRKEPVIVHIDMDCFFVSIALRTRPELRRKPVVITHSKAPRRFKISNGMWMREAVKRCPNLVCLPYQFDDYRETSKQLYTIIGQYTLDIKAVSCDELYFDLAPLCEELKIVNPLDVITEMRKEIFEATGCPASAGLGKCFPLRPLLIPLAAGPSPLMARLATRKAKPNGQHHVRQELVGEFMKRVPLTAIPGVGPALITKLAGRFGAVQTCQQLFSRRFRGIADPRLELTDSSTRKSISCDVNFGVRLQTEADFHEFLLDIAKQLAKKLHDASLKGSTLTMKLLIRHPDAPLEPEKYGAHGWCNSISKSIPFMKPSDDPKVLHNEAKRLGKMMQPPIADIRGIGLQMTQLLSIHDPMANRSRAFAILKPDKKRARLDKKYGLREGQRYVQKRTIERLPPRRHECICGGDHEMAVNLERMPSFKTVAALRCFFHQLVQEADFAALNAHFRAIMEGIERAAHLADSRWTDVMRYLLRDINLRAWKLYQYLVLSGCDLRLSPAEMWVLLLIQPLTPPSGRLSMLNDWTKKAHVAMNETLADHPIAAPVCAAAVAVGAFGLWMWGGRPAEGRVKPIVDLNSQTRVLPDGSRVCTFHRSDQPATGLYSDVRTLFEGIRRGAQQSNNGPMLGHRVKQADGSEPYVWLSYNEWIIVEYAAYAFSNVIVPLYDTLGSDACSFIINQTEISLVVCDTTEKTALTDEAVQTAKAADIRLMTFAELEKVGREVTDRAPLQPPQPDDLATICFTSGTTGAEGAEGEWSLGVMLSHGNIIADGTTLELFREVGFGPKDTVFSFLPLAHSKPSTSDGPGLLHSSVFERVVQSVVYTEGGRVGFFRGDIKTLADDMKALRPTVLLVVPRVLNRIYDRVIGEVNRSFFLKRWLFRFALGCKVREMKRGVFRGTGLADRVFQKIRNGMGGRVKLVITGSAPLGSHVLNFIRGALGSAIVVEGYGQTEAVACASITLEGDAIPGHVGVPIPANAIKLVDVPELNYLAKENAGEGKQTSAGYYKDAEKTREAIDADGWLHTGDIGRWTERGTLKIVDRKKHIFKLAQGEYVAVERLESVYVMSELVHQIFVDGHSLESYLVAVVVPEPEPLIKWHKEETGKDCSLEEICRDPIARAHVLKALNEQGKAGHLNSIEQVKAVWLDPQEWTVQSGLLTPTLKSVRQKLRLRYKGVIADLYAGK